MPRTVEEEPLQKHTLLFYQGDFDRMRAIYPDMPPAVAIRRLVRAHLDRRDAQVQTPPPNVKLDL